MATTAARRRRFGIRARITGGSLLIALAFSVVAGVLIYTQVARIVSQGSIAVLRADAAPYESAVAAGTPLGSPGPAELIAVVDPSGTAVLDTLPPALSRSLDRVLAGPDPTHAITVGGVEYLVRDADVVTAEGRWHVVSARNAASQNEVLSAMTGLLVLSIAVINIAFGVGSWLLSTLALRPVGRMRASAETLAAEAGTELLPAGPPDDEIAELARTLNALILRLRAATERERHIVSDASHELRTPLALVRMQLEIARAEAASVDQLTSDIARAEAALARLQKIADGLLELSRVDAAGVQGESSLAEISAEVTDAVDRARMQAVDVGAVVEYELPETGAAAEAASTTDPGLRVHMAASDVGRVLENLVSNALAAGSSRLAVTLRTTATEIELVVSDDGGGMSEDFAPRAFERFSRQSTARTASGAGLGLAIVDGLVTRAGGSIDLHNRPGSGLDVLVRMPLLPASAAGEVGGSRR
ncbi:HAMP domain-containing sensor histidine kinase [Rathayibacter sp. YIM 133350]|uniref:sensor histidine kinase n=1 Tax=Rathayibacter sp. YIM 133350 TaxID=3131992 RepID=UPI00307F4C3C